MMLELSNEDSRVLKDALDATLRALRDDLASAEPPELKEALRHRYDRLHDLQRRLEPFVESEQVYA